MPTTPIARRGAARRSCCGYPRGAALLRLVAIAAAAAFIAATLALHAGQAGAAAAAAATHTHTHTHKHTHTPSTPTTTTTTGVRLTRAPPPQARLSEAAPVEDRMAGESASGPAAAPGGRGDGGMHIPVGGGDGGVRIPVASGPGARRVEDYAQLGEVTVEHEPAWALPPGVPWFALYWCVRARVRSWARVCSPLRRAGAR